MTPLDGNGFDIQRRLRGLRQLTRKATLDELLNVFTPNNPVTNPSKFAGRQSAMEAMITTLLTSGAHGLVYGERGCGKTSLARMLFNIAQGKLDILDYYGSGLRRALEQKGFFAFLLGSSAKRFTTIWVDGFGKSVDEVLHAILTRRQERHDDVDYGPGLMAYLPTEADQIEVASKIGFDKIFTSETSVKEIQIKEKPLNIKEACEIAVQRFSQSHKEDIIVIVDEFETVTNKSDIAQYLKSLNGVRFFLVGIAESAIELTGQHASIARDLHGINVPPMTDEELRFLLQLSSFILSPLCRFDDPAIEDVVGYSNGAPYWCHFLGNALVAQEVELAGGLAPFLNLSEATVIDPSRVQRLIDALPRRPDCSIYEQQLASIVMDDDAIKAVLREIVGVHSNIINTPVVYRSIAQKTDVAAAAARDIVEGMLQMSVSPFEVRNRIGDSVSFSFRDPNFKRYIRIRLAGAGHAP